MAQAVAQGDHPQHLRKVLDCGPGGWPSVNLQPTSRASAASRTLAPTLLEVDLWRLRLVCLATTSVSPVDTSVLVRAYLGLKVDSPEGKVIK